MAQKQLKEETTGMNLTAMEVYHLYDLRLVLPKDYEGVDMKFKVDVDITVNNQKDQEFNDEIVPLKAVHSTIQH